MLGKELKSMRVYCDYTLRELADKISTEEKTVYVSELSNYENGKTEVKLSLLVKVAEVCKHTIKIKFSKNEKNDIFTLSKNF